MAGDTSADVSRRDRIADAALVVLGTGGARGLTHRAVDRAAHISDGSTSYYCRTRIELLRLCAERLAVSDGRAAISVPKSVDSVDLLANVMVVWLAPDTAYLARARIELFLIAHDDAELAKTMRAIRVRFTALAAQFATSSEAADFVVSALDGILLAELCLASTPLTLARARSLIEPLRQYLR